MRTIFAITAVTIAAAGVAQAEPRIDALCGADHINEVAAHDVSSNPDGYYIRSLQTQLTHGDPRIVEAVGNEFHVCTRSAATPDMDSNRAILLMSEREVTYLFVPTNSERGGAGS